MKTNLRVAVALCALLAACGATEQDSPSPSVAVPGPKASPLALGGELPLHQSSASDLLDPVAIGWGAVSAHRVELTMVPPVHPSINLRHDAAAPPVPVTLQAATDGSSVYLRLRWADGSENTETSRQLFADGAAVQFALAAGEQSSFMMGAPNGPVNLWYWRADMASAQNLAAGGFGSTTSLPAAGLQSQATYLDSGEWVLVFSRPIAGKGEHQVDLASMPVHLGLATWQGEQRQRDGLKHVTMGWLKLVTAS